RCGQCDDPRPELRSGRAAPRRAGRLPPRRTERGDHPGHGGGPARPRHQDLHPGPLHGLARRQRAGSGLRRGRGAVLRGQAVQLLTAVRLAHEPGLRFPLRKKPSISPKETALPKESKRPCSAISLADWMKPFQAARASAPPVLIRRTPRPASSAWVKPGAPTSTLTGFGATAATTTSTCSFVFSPGA